MKFSARLALMSIAIEPGSKTDRDAFYEALTAVAAAEPAVSVPMDPEPGRRVVGAAEEARLKSMIDKLRPSYRGTFVFGAPQVIYRETLTKRIEKDYTRKKQMMRGNAVVINAMVPLANMFGHVNELRFFSPGRANYTMRFSHYQRSVPPGWRPTAARDGRSLACVTCERVGNAMQPLTRKAFLPYLQAA